MRIPYDKIPVRIRQRSPGIRSILYHLLFLDKFHLPVPHFVQIKLSVIFKDKKMIVDNQVGSLSESFVGRG